MTLRNITLSSQRTLINYNILIRNVLGLIPNTGLAVRSQIPIEYSSEIIDLLLEIRILNHADKMLDCLEILLVLFTLERHGLNLFLDFIHQALFLDGSGRAVDLGTIPFIFFYDALNLALYLVNVILDHL